MQGKYLVDTDFEYLEHYASGAAIDDNIAVVAMGIYFLIFNFSFYL